MSIDEIGGFHGHVPIQELGNAILLQCVRMDAKAGKAIVLQLNKIVQFGRNDATQALFNHEFQDIIAQRQQE